MAKDTRVLTNTGSRRRRQPMSFDQIRQWARDSRNELRKVTWPTPEQTRNLTIVVIVVCVVMSAFLGLIDALLSTLIRLIIGA